MMAAKTIRVLSTVFLIALAPACAVDEAGDADEATDVVAADGDDIRSDETDVPGFRGEVVRVGEYVHNYWAPWFSGASYETNLGGVCPPGTTRDSANITNTGTGSCYMVRWSDGNPVNCSVMVHISVPRGGSGSCRAELFAKRLW